MRRRTAIIAVVGALLVGLLVGALSVGGARWLSQRGATGATTGLLVGGVGAILLAPYHDSTADHAAPVVEEHSPPS